MEPNNLVDGLTLHSWETHTADPVIATSWDDDPATLTYIFHVRNDVRWTNGAPVTAADFEWTWKRVLPSAAIETFGAEKWAEREIIQSYGLFTLERWERVMKSHQRLRTLCAMDKRARVLAALRGEAVDRVPISFWGHHYVAENSAEGLAGETLRQLQRFDWDFLKPQSRAQAFAEMWGLTYTPSSLANVKYATSHLPLSGAADLAGLKPADPGKGALGEQIESLHRIRASVGASVPIVWTVFSPLMIARYLLLGDAAQVVQVARSDPGALAHALEAITNTLLGYVRAILASGADGIFYATNLATRDLLTVEECERFQRPYDLRVLAEAASAPFNVMHVCGQDALFDAFVDYPVAAFSFALGPTNPTLADAHRRTGKAVMGGVPAALATLTAAEVAGHARAAVDDMARRWLLLAPGCSVAIDTPDELLLAAREVAHTARSD